jgi:hypothetical protein
MAEKENNYKKMDLDDLIADCEVNFTDCTESLKYKKTSKSKRQHQKLINFFGSVTEYLKELETIKQKSCKCLKP